MTLSYHRDVYNHFRKCGIIRFKVDEQGQTVPDVIRDGVKTLYHSTMMLVWWKVKILEKFIQWKWYDPIEPNQINYIF